MPGNALNRETWSQLTSFSCPNNSWTAGYGDASWQIQTNAECVAAAEADASCATPLVLNIGWDACYCATDACDAPVATSYMTTYRYAGDRSRPRAARRTLRELYVGESVSAVTSADAVADSVADSVAHGQGALVVVVVVVVRQAGDSGNCLDGDPRCWHLCMCWSDVILLWTNVPRVMGFERSLRIRSLAGGISLVSRDFHALRLRRRAHSLVEL